MYLTAAPASWLCFCTIMLKIGWGLGAKGWGGSFRGGCVCVCLSILSLLKSPFVPHLSWHWSEETLPQIFVPAPCSDCLSEWLSGGNGVWNKEAMGVFIVYRAQISEPLCLFYVRLVSRRDNENSGWNEETVAGDEGEEKGVVLAIAGKEPCQTELGGGVMFPWAIPSLLLVNARSWVNSAVLSCPSPGPRPLFFFPSDKQWHALGGGLPLPAVCVCVGVWMGRWVSLQGLVRAWATALH